jgi:hypothetical protein
MKSSVPGKATSKAEIQNISKLGLWLFAAGKEFYLPYEKHPWFKDATVGEIMNVQFHFGHHLHWPDLDVDLDLDSLEHPERCPLTARHIPRRENRRKKAA